MLSFVIVALMMAVHTYDPESAGFLTHAEWTIRGYMHRVVLAYSTLVRIPGNIKGEKRTQAVEEYFDDRGAGTIKKLDIPYEYHALHVKHVISTVLSGLRSRQRLAIKLYFGLDGYEEHTLESTGQVLGVTKERARQLVDSGLSKLRSRISHADLA